MWFMGLKLALFLAVLTAANANADSFGNDVDNQITKVLNSAAGWLKTGSDTSISDLVAKAERALSDSDVSGNLIADINDGAVKFTAQRAVADKVSTTVRFAQTYKGLEVVGNEAMVHFDRNGKVHDISGKGLNAVISTTPKFSADDALKLLQDRYKQNVKLSEAPKLKVLRDFDGKAHLVYHMLTRSTRTHDGQEVYLDARTGDVVLEFERAYDAAKGQRTVYTADTDTAREHVDERGYPTDINLG
jgi:Zn-dependent metalloprotease